MLERYCTNCGFVGGPQKFRPGSSGLEVFLWVVSIVALLIPAIIYSLMRSARAYYGCPQCRAPNMIPLDSPKASEAPPVRAFSERQAAPPHRTIRAPASNRALKYLIGGITCLALILFSVLKSGPQKVAEKGTGAKPSRNQEAQKPQATVNNPAVVRPSIPPPSFRVYRSKIAIDGGTAIVVPVSTTDEQLKSLLWLLREKVGSGRFRDIGMTRPTDKRWGKSNYSAGSITVYRGEKCANEGFNDSSVPGPCGYGEHAAAAYDWGFTDRPSQPSDPTKDYGRIYSANGAAIQVF